MVYMDAFNNRDDDNGALDGPNKPTSSLVLIEKRSTYQLRLRRLEEERKIAC